MALQLQRIMSLQKFFRSPGIISVLEILFSMNKIIGATHSTVLPKNVSEFIKREQSMDSFFVCQFVAGGRRGGVNNETKSPRDL